MQNLNKEHDYHASCSNDVSVKANITIWLYFIIMGIVLFLTIAGLIIMFQFWLEEEQTKKIGMVQTAESKDYKAVMNAYVNGHKGVFDDKKNTSIDEAIKKFLNGFRNQ
jgi:hypothetical protein